MRKATIPMLKAAALALGVLAAAPAAAQPSVGRPCHVPGVTDLATCHRITVPEDRSAPAGRTIELHVAVLPARGSAKPPDSALFLLAGGPGQAANDMGPLVGTALAKVRDSRAIVLMDQRGTGRSNPLACSLPGDDAITLDLNTESMAKALTACRAGWNADLRRYSTLDVVEDIEAVRQALGYAKLDLWGGSWGTRTALLYMRAYPGSVRSAVLDGVSPPNDLLLTGEPAHSQAALDALFEACAADAACAGTYPDLGARFQEWLEELGEGSTVTMADGLNGKVETVTLSRDGAAQSVRAVLYSTITAAKLPYALDRLIGKGDATSIVPLAFGAGSVVRDTMFLGSTLSSLCREEVPRTEGVPLAAGFTGESWLASWRTMCRDFPADPLPDGYAEPVTTDVPVLLLSGALDPVTPPASADKAAAHLPRAWHLVAPATGHIVTGGAPCAGDLIAEFVEAADGSRLDAACLGERGRPPFMTTPQGPTP